MANFKRINSKPFERTKSLDSASDQYWKSLSFPVTVKEFSLIDYIDVCPVDPYLIAITAGSKIDIYHPEIIQIWGSLTRFQKSAFGGTFRNDGQLLIAGTEDGEIKLFDYKRKRLLRLFKGHAGPVHRVQFVQGVPQIASFADDQTVGLWDVTGETQISSMNEHKDFIRAGVASPVSEYLLLSGSYDHTIKVWDTRTSSSILTVEHGSPVESLLWYPSGNVFISAGGTELHVWDIVGGKLMARLSQHHKTITSLSFASDYKRLLSGSLDQHVKVYDVNTYEVTHTLNYSSPILALCVSPQKDRIVTVGMLSRGAGLLSFQHRKVDDKENETPVTKNLKNFQPETFDAVVKDEIVEAHKIEDLRLYEKYLIKYRYGRVLDIVTKKNFYVRKPHVTVAVLRELLRRKAMKTALAGRDCDSLSNLVNFITKYISNSNFLNVILDTTNCLLDTYSDSIEETPELYTLLAKLKTAVSKEMATSREYISLIGVFEMFLTASEPQKPTEETSSSASYVTRISDG